MNWAKWWKIAAKRYYRRFLKMRDEWAVAWQLVAELKERKDDEGIFDAIKAACQDKPRETFRQTVERWNACREGKLLMHPDTLLAFLEDTDDHTMVEALADVSHQIWAHWMRYMVPVLLDEHFLPKGVFYEEETRKAVHGIFQWSDEAQAALDRWRRQMETPYAMLTDKEKDSDREQAEKILKVVKANR